ncbi:MAG: hypothetical protein LBT08_03700 [Synergistaceae bacterium]|nr:hypothetical protein [Synergistaceae bacterium]
MSDDNSIDTQSLSQFLENQKYELSIREKGIELEREKALAASESDQRQFLYAQKQLDAMERDRHDDRVYKETLERKSLHLLIAFIIAAIIFLIIAVLKDKDQLLIELFKAVAYGGSFGMGGYAWGRYRQNHDDKKTKE